MESHESLAIRISHVCLLIAQAGRSEKHFWRFAKGTNGWSAGATAGSLKGSRRWVTKALARFRARRCLQELADGKHSGRPPRAPGLSTER
jgi:hypothetical protein